MPASELSLALLTSLHVYESLRPVVMFTPVSDQSLRLHQSPTSRHVYTSLRQVTFTPVSDQSRLHQSPTCQVYISL